MLRYSIARDIPIFSDSSMIDMFLFELSSNACNIFFWLSFSLNDSFGSQITAFLSSSGSSYNYLNLDNLHTTP